ncbi:MAG: aminotransferase class I/II-fold pyridoxal phosphate-dependent enzyme [Halofilum sp. (in: g-proteobacteria)]|nr:aminotransferase class I/II-fold pyridoxal phosphate-dependent enzyme [Halofilum sp. (in: g-proteobacteria)]
MNELGKSLKPSGPQRRTLDFYHSAHQMRFDTWHHVEDLLERLVARHHRDDAEKLTEEIHTGLSWLQSIEDYTAFPSREDFTLLWRLYQRGEYELLVRVVARIVRALSSDTYRTRHIELGRNLDIDDDTEGMEIERDRETTLHKPYFELLVVDDISDDEVSLLREGLRKIRRPEDRFVYDVVVVPSFEDALIAALFNYNIQAVVIRYGFPFESKNHLHVLHRLLRNIDASEYANASEHERSPLLAACLSKLRPELDLYMVTDLAVENIAGSITQTLRRIFYQQEDYLELHLSIQRGIQDRYQTPFFTALKEYSRQPTGVFHAMPISRGKSVTRSHWIQDMAQFYGTNIFLAETSATSGGLDSLLQPHGPLKKAQELAARAFGAGRTYFVTNGTSTANKIVVQALVRPGDIVLVDRDCHKSHHYGMVLAGADVCYLDSYPLHEYSMYGAVPLREIKHRLLEYKRAGQLHRVKMLLLTNCTFDGVVYNVERVMEECLAIKPDLAFLWDEAWFAFASFTPVYRQRTAMATAQRLTERYRSQAYRDRYAAWKETMDGKDDDDEALLDARLMPDPDQVRVRVYATHSTHKSLTSLRQGSMIHVYDQDFRRHVEEPFDEAYMTHTSTSPNYQILASLDLGRRQVELEGFELVQKQLERAMSLRERVASHPLLRRFFRFLVASDMVPPEFRPSGIEAYYDPETGWRNNNMEEAWAIDDFVVDPTRLTLYVGETGIDGDTFKNEYLMDKYGIQINKTSRNTVLFMTNIGTTRSSVAYLIEVLVKIATALERELEDASPAERRIHEARVRSLTKEQPPLPDFSYFHKAFRPRPQAATPEGDLRKAFFLAYHSPNCEYLRIDDGSVDAEMERGREVVSASFVIPYPPGFPILVPGQVISEDILRFMRVLDVKEIHGYRPELGLQVFCEEALEAVADPATARDTAAGGRS